MEAKDRGRRGKAKRRWMGYAREDIREKKKRGQRKMYRIIARNIESQK